MAALAAASLRLASRWAPSGAERVLAAAAVGASAAVVEALALGLFGLGGTTLALLVAALATWAAARRLLPATPGPGQGAELAGWWRALAPRGRLAAGAGLGAFGWWVIWIFINPAVGFDASLYHHAEVAGWVSEGYTGSIEQVSYEFPVGNYPLVNEVLGAWGGGLAKSFVPLALWPAAAFALVGLAAWSGLRRLGLPRPVAGLATAAVLSIPSLVTQVAEPQTDLPALAWLLTAAALAAGARERPALLAPALLAAGLAVGTKTTTGLLAVVALVLAWRAARGRLPGRELAAAGAAALLVGGLWYARNLILHGSPLWPFAPGPFGDPTPRWLATIDTTFLERPIATLSEARPREYAQRLGGSLLLLLGALAAPLVVRTRAVALAAAVTLVGLFAWVNAPATGLSDSPLVWIPEGWPESGTRYLLPVLAAAALTLALAARPPRGHSRLVAVLLGAVAAGNLIVLAGRGDPFLPPTQLLAAAAVGALAVLAGERLAGAFAPSSHGRGRHPAAAPAALAGAVVLVALMSLAASGYVGRHAKVEESSALGSDVVGWLAARPEFQDGDEPVAIASRAMISPLAGDRLQHHLTLVPANEPCARVRERARRGWVVASDPEFANGFLGVGAVRAPACMSGERPVFRGTNFNVYREAR